MANDKYTDRSCREILTIELTARRTRNPAYSLRAFARDLGVGVTSLSDFFNNKRKLSKSNLRKIVEALKLSPAQGDQLIANASLKVGPTALRRDQLAEDQFRLIADWYYFAILNLAKIEGSKGNARWIAKRLGLDEDSAKEALNRLQRMGLLKVHKGFLQRTSRPLDVSYDIPSSAIRKHHTDQLRLAEWTLLNMPVDQREFNAITLPGNPEQIKEAMKIVGKAMERANDVLEKGTCTEVYVMSFQLFPITREIREEEK